MDFSVIPINTWLTRSQGIFTVRPMESVSGQSGRPALEKTLGLFSFQGSEGFFRQRDRACPNIPLAVLLILFLCLSLSQKAFSREAYFIDGQKVLLYKVINWWYDCLPQERHLMCQKIIRYESSGNARLEYDMGQRKLTIFITTGFPDRMSLFNPDRQKEETPKFKCLRLDNGVFGPARAKDIPNQPGPFTMVFLRVAPNRASELKNMEMDLTFVVEGTIKGLANGKIALHRHGPLIKACPANPQSKSDPVSGLIINARTNQVIAEYILTP